jgi:hypothetical protein
MVIDEYLKYKSVEEASAAYQQDCPLNSPRLSARRSSRREFGKLPPLKPQYSKETFKSRGSALRDEDMHCGTSSAESNSLSPQKRRRNIDLQQMLENNNPSHNCQKSSNRALFSKQCDSFAQREFMRSTAVETTQADTMLGITTLEDGPAANNTTLFRSLHESQLGTTQVLPSGTELFNNEQSLMMGADEGSKLSPCD